MLKTGSHPPRSPFHDNTSVSSRLKQPSTEMAGAWLPLKKAVSTSTPSTVPEATPSRTTTQSKGSGLCLLVSQPSYQAPVYTIFPGCRIGAAGFIRFAASANHSSEKPRILPPSADETRSVPPGVSTSIVETRLPLTDAGRAKGSLNVTGSDWGCLDRFQLILDILHLAVCYRGGSLFGLNTSTG